MTDYHLAQLNIAKLKFALDAPEMAGFVDQLEAINALADDAPGFVWRLQTDEGDATAIDYFGPDYLVNMSVWESIKALHDYVYRSSHREVLARRKEWFDYLQQAYSVLWWIPKGHIPTVEEAGDRLDRLRNEGPNAKAFTFKQAYPPD